MAAELNNLVRLQKSQIKPAAEMLARAFQDDPSFIYIFPDVSQRKNKLPYLWQCNVRYGVLYGQAYAISPNLEGVAVWLPYEKADMSLWGMIRTSPLPMLPKIGWGPCRRGWLFNKYANAVHKRHAPSRHWFLQSLGVDPVFQGKGHASTLLRAMFAIIDKEDLPCYLDTQTEKNVSMYQHYGFKVVEEFKIPGTEFRNWAMLREKAS
jgi:ribosomal protein S18 acetylase RimI-like enzyme